MTLGTRSTRIAALTGVAFVVFLVPAVLFTANSPATDASAAKVQQYFLAHHNKYSISALFTVLAIVFGLFFYGYLRAYFRKNAGMEWLAAIFFSGAITFAVSGALGAGVDAVIGDDPGALSASSLQLLNQMVTDFNYPATCAGLAVLYIAAGLVIHKSKALPVWLGWVSWILGLASASFLLGFIGLFAMAPWALIVSIMLASRNPSIDDGSSATPVAITPPGVATPN
jgi:cytochrome c oxidase subunit IV